MKAKRYQVLNPRDVPKGLPVIGFRDGQQRYDWREGDVFEPPPGFDADGRLLRDGFYREVSGG